LHKQQQLATEQFKE